MPISTCCHRCPRVLPSRCVHVYNITYLINSHIVPTMLQALEHAFVPVNSLNLKQAAFVCLFAEGEYESPGGYKAAGWGRSVHMALGTGVRTVSVCRICVCLTAMSLRLPVCGPRRSSPWVSLHFQDGEAESWKQLTQGESESWVLGRAGVGWFPRCPRPLSRLPNVIYTTGLSSTGAPPPGLGSRSLGHSGKGGVDTRRWT